MRTAINKKNEAGFILITVLLMIVALSLIGITGMVISSNEVMIAGYINKSKEAFYITEAALEEGKYLILNDYTKGKPTAVGPGTLTDTTQTWTVDEFQNMHLVDVGGNEFRIMNNDANTLTLNPATTPLDGVYHIVFSYHDRGINGVNGLGTLDRFQVMTQDWSVVDYSGCMLVDSSSATYNINGFDAVDSTKLVVTGTPADGNWEIICNRGGVDQMTITDPAYVLPTFITNDPWGWILIDENGNKFNIEDGGGGFAGNAVFLDINAGTPAHGDIIISRPAWIHTMTSPLYGGVTGTVGIMTKTYAIGPATGTVTVTAQKNGTTKGSYTVTTVGSIAKARKAIQMTLTDSGNGDTNFRDWHEITPP